MQKGLATLLSKKVAFEKISEYKDKEGRYNMVIGRLEDLEINFVNVYAPTGSQLTVYKYIFDLMITKARRYSNLWWRL